jgi:hypothetical protein
MSAVLGMGGVSMTVTEIRIAGRYRLGRSLGVGGMGRVWLARDEVLHRDVAIKEVALPFGLSDNEREELRARTLREARAAARLSHPNVVRIYDVIHGEQQPWIVMEYVPSRSLLDAVQQDGPLPVAEVARIGLAMLGALEAANRAGVLHRDVKPGNVLLAADRVVLTDFGSAIYDDGEGAITRTGVLLGSPQYMAPERVRSGIATPESDLWSLGTTLYVAVEGRSAFERPTAFATLIAVATERPDPTRLAGPLRPVINGLLQKNPRARMSAAEIDRRLRDLVESPPAVHRLMPPVRRERAAVTVPVPAPAPPTARPRWRWIAAAAACAAVLVAVAAVAAGSSGGRSRSVAEGTPAAVPLAVASSAAPPARAIVNPDVLPAGLAWYADGSGFRVGFPAGWNTLREGPSAMLFCEPAGPRTLRVHPWERSGSDLAAALVKDEEMERSMLTGYHRIRIEALPGGAVAEWEYTFDDPTMGGNLHGVNRAFLVAGRPYLIEWRTSPEQWPGNVATYSAIAASFQTLSRSQFH